MKNLKDNPDAGFSLIEVVVAIVMIFFFTNVALQMLVISGLFKQKATQYTTAINLIQQDMEKIKSAADTYSFPTTSAAAVGVTTVTLNPPTGLATANFLTATNKVQFSNSSDIYTISSISSNVITISSALKKAVTASNYALSKTSCDLKTADSASTNKMATYFDTSLPITATATGNTAYTVNGTTYSYYPVTGTPTNLIGQYYWLLRNETVSTDAPYNILKINYVVQANKLPNTTPAPLSTNAPTILDPAYTLATSSTEVIPYASLQCPSK